MIRRLFFIWVIVIAAPAAALATHIVGGEIYYTCLGGDSYRITLKVYRDCLNGQAPFDDPASLGVYNAAGELVTVLSVPYEGSDHLEVMVSNPCLQAPPNICVEEAVYNVAVDLPFISGGYHIAYQRCCRNESVMNILGPGAQGATYYLHIPEEALNTCNSSPRFNNFPPLALCIGDMLIFDHSAYDPDGDQIVYSLCSPNNGGSQAFPAPVPPDPPPYSPIVWGGGYSSGYPIDASPQLSIDAVTGTLSGMPTQSGQYVVGVCAEEYRDGQLLSVNKRDFQFNVVNCSSDVQAVIPPQEENLPPCSGLEVSFGNSSVNAQFYHWDFGLGTVEYDTSNLEDPDFVFPDAGSYNITLVANPGYPCADTTLSTITVLEPVIAEVVHDGEACFDVNSFDFQAGGQFSNDAGFYWEFGGGTPLSSTEMNPSGIMFDSIGTHSVSLTIVDGICSDDAQIEISTYLRPTAYFHPNFFSGCVPLIVGFVDSSFSSTAHHVLWDFGDGTSSTYSGPVHGYASAGIYGLTLTIWTTDGCIDTSVFILPDAVTVFPLPQGTLTAEPDTQSVFEPEFHFTGVSDDAVSCLFVPGNSDTLAFDMQTCDFEYVFSDTGDYRPMMIFIDEHGCTFSDTALVRVEPEVRFWLPNAFTPNSDRLNDRWGAVSMGWKEFELWVYDRWGELVFHSTDPLERWDGTKNNQGNLEPVQGVYSYRILARSVNRTVVRQSGSVTIVL